MATHTSVTINALDTPTVAISCSMAPKSAGLFAAVRTGNHGSTSPCQMCSNISSAEPPQSRLESHFNLRENGILAVVSKRIAAPFA